MQPPGDGGQGDGIVGGEHRLEPHQQGQQKQHLAPLVRLL